MEALGIELYSILIYIGGTGVLLVILGKLLYNPVNTFVEKRQQTIASKLDEADRIKSEFENKLIEMEAAKASAQAELKAELERMESFVSDKKKELVAEMEAERTKVLEKANAEIEAKKAKLLSDAEGQVLALMQKIILEIVQNKVPADVIEASITDAWKNYKN